MRRNTRSLSVWTLLFCMVLACLDAYAVGGDPLVVRQRHPMELLVVRLRPNDDVYTRLQQIIEAENIEAGCVLACVGSMKNVVLRFANQPEVALLDSKHEVVSLSGTLSCNGSHLHISVADNQGKTVGGHLMPGGKVFTTLEIVIGIMPQLSFVREMDPESGFRELIIRKRVVGAVSEEEKNNK